jgi:Holliday junction resolvasome RuvABC endonuclease subunit
MSGLRRYAWVLAIYLNTRGFAFVIFESSLSPVDWGVKEIRGPRKHAQSLVKVTAILDQYQPDVLIIQDTFSPGTLRARRIVKLNTAIAELAERRRMALYMYSRADIWNAFRDVGVTNKQELAMVIAVHIPAFERYVPTPRKPWESEDSRMGIFDAAALALTFFQDETGGKSRSPT